MSLRRVLVTGGRGFIGSHLVELLARNRLTIVSLDTKPASDERIDGVVAAVGDVRDRQIMSEVLSSGDCDCIFDLASLTDVGLASAEYRRNVEQTMAMVEYCQRYKIRKYIFFSTQLVFRAAGVLPNSDDDYDPTDFYGEAKVQSEILIRNSLPSEQCLILRPAYIWGPGHDRFRDGLLYRLLRGQ